MWKNASVVELLTDLVKFSFSNIIPAKQNEWGIRLSGSVAAGILLTRQLSSYAFKGERPMLCLKVQARQYYFYGR